MAARKPPRGEDPQREGAARSLRDQLRALVPKLVSRAAGENKIESARAAPAVRTRDDHLTFEQLVATSVVKPRTEPEAPQPAAPLPTLERKRGPRLWVEHGEGVVRARAEDAPERLLQELERGRIVPRRHIDLHRLSAAGAREVLDRDIPSARREGVPCVLVVCGRGKHSSPEAPVLPDVAIERLSEELAADVLAFTSAPRRWGGQGALVVVLRAPNEPQE